MHDARAVANYFLDRAKESKLKITAMALLKVLYFAHGWHLVKFDQPLVAQPFEAWRHGPVVRVVYDQIKRLGSSPIDHRLTAFNISVGGFAEANPQLDDSTQEFLNNIFDYYSKFHPFVLSDLTHEKGSPWDVVWQTAEKKAVPGMLIPNSAIKEWFGKSSAEKVIH